MTNDQVKANISDAPTGKADTWGVVPEGLKLRESLPKISGETRDRVIAWADRQWWASEWLWKRTREYGEGFARHPDADLERLAKATAGLDLLEHVSQLRSGQAVAWLRALDEVAAVSGEVERRGVERRGVES